MKRASGSLMSKLVDHVDGLLLLRLVRSRSCCDQIVCACLKVSFSTLSHDTSIQSPRRKEH
eukprot:7078742-Prorocentrum_lima.AAC.1